MQTSPDSGSSGGGLVWHAAPANNTDEVADRNIQEAFLIASRTFWQRSTGGCRPERRPAKVDCGAMQHLDLGAGRRYADGRAAVGDTRSRAPQRRAPARIVACCCPCPDQFCPLSAPYAFRSVSVNVIRDKRGRAPVLRIHRRRVTGDASVVIARRISNPMRRTPRDDPAAGAVGRQVVGTRPRRGRGIPEVRCGGCHH